MFQFLWKKYFISLDLPQILFLIVTILKELNLLQDLDFGLSHLREHKFKHKSDIHNSDTINPLCNCGQDIESSTHFFLHFPFFINERCTLLRTLWSLDSKLLDCTDYDLTQTSLFGNASQTSSNNFKIINASIDYILSSKRFDEPLFWINSLISKLEFNQQFSFYLYIVVISYFVLPGTFRYIGIWRSCNFVCLFFFLLFYVKWSVHIYSYI